MDFGASDAPLKPAELSKLGMGQFPLVIGGIVPVVNVDGIEPGQIRFTGPLLADIYLSKIKSWNDSAIGKLNPGLKLPNAAITVVHRADGSGTIRGHHGFYGVRCRSPARLKHDHSGQSDDGNEQKRNGP